MASFEYTIRPLSGVELKDWGTLLKVKTLLDGKYELARAQGFDDSYVIDRDCDSRPVTKADQVKLIGNSVCPQPMRAIVKANVVDLLLAQPVKRPVRKAVVA